MPNRQLIENQLHVRRCRETLQKVAYNMTDRNLPTSKAREIAYLAAAEAYALILNIVMTEEQKTRKEPR